MTANDILIISCYKDFVLCDSESPKLRLGAAKALVDFYEKFPEEEVIILGPDDREIVHNSHRIAVCFVNAYKLGMVV